MVNKYMVIGAAAAGLALVFIVYKGAGKAAELVGDAAQAINPLNNENIINRAANGGYQWATGSDGSIGTDLWDAVHGGALDVTSDKNPASRAAEGTYGAVTGSTGSIGSDIYDAVDSVEKWFKGIW